MAQRLVDSTKQRDFTIRMSNIGKPCPRQLWLEKNYPDDKVPMRPEVLLKFMFGDLIEELILFLAQVAGHKVEGRQDTQEIAGIKGHRDAVIDGTLVDVKSASSFAFKKFQDGLTQDTDAFGYMTQLQSYLHASQKDDVVTDKNQAAFFAVDKQHGHMVLDMHQYNPTINYEELYEQKKNVINGDLIPERAFEPVEDGYKHKDKGFIANGNLKLGTNCSYCDRKYKCYDNIRTFLSSKGPVFFTHIEKEPKMLEITDTINGGIPVQEEKDEG